MFISSAGGPLTDVVSETCMTDSCSIKRGGGRRSWGWVAGEVGRGVEGSGEVGRGVGRRQEKLGVGPDRRIDMRVFLAT